MKCLARVGGKICFAKRAVPATHLNGLSRHYTAKFMKNQPPAPVERAQAAIKWIAYATVFSPKK